MSLDILQILNELMEAYSIETDADEEVLEEKDNEIISNLYVEENKKINAVSSSAMKSLLLDSGSGQSRRACCIPPLNLMRCSSFKGPLDWVDSFLWLVSTQYRVLSSEDQQTLANAFLSYITENDDFHTLFVQKLKTKPALLASIPIHTNKDVVRFLNSKDTVNIITLVVLIFRYNSHVFRLNAKDFLSPTYISKHLGQDKNRFICFIQTEGDHIEPLFQLNEAFGAEFTWDETLMCSLKDVCNTNPALKDTPYMLPGDCDTLPTGKTLDSIDNWITNVFFTRIVPDEEQEPIDDTDSYPLEKLQDDVPYYGPIQEKITESMWHTAETVGDGTCLVHAFLQCVSPIYRSIPHSERAFVGQWFRRAVLAPLYIPTPLTEEEKKSKFKVKDYELEVVKYNRILNTLAWLEQDDLQKIIDLYEINVVVINTSSRDLIIYKPQSGFKDHPYIFMVCSDERHYSSIYLPLEETFMLSEEDMLASYPELVGDMYKDTDYETVRKEIVDTVRGTVADEGVKQGIVENIFRHIRSRTGEPNASPPEKPARNLEGALNGYAGKLGIPANTFNRFRQTLKNSTGGGKRRSKTLKARR